MKRRIYILLLLLATLPSIVVKADEKHKFQLSRQISIINAIIKDLDLFYVDSIMPEMLVTKSIDAMLNNLDPYTEYYPANKADELKMMTTGKYAGIGSVIRFHTDKKTLGNQNQKISERYFFVLFLRLNVQVSVTIATLISSPSITLPFSSFNKLICSVMN